LRAVNLYINHNLAPDQIVGGAVLGDMLTLAFMQRIRLRDITAWGAWGVDVLVKRLLDADYIEFSSEEGMGLEVWVTQKALSIEFLDPDYQWEGTLRQPEKVAALNDVCGHLAQLFGSRCVLVAPSCDLKASVAREFFAEAISIEELIVRVEQVVGAPFKSLQDGRLAMNNYDANDDVEGLRRGYFVWCWQQQ